MAEASKLATDSGAYLKVHVGTRPLTCTYLAHHAAIPKGAAYIRWLPGWDHRTTDRLCMECASRVGFMRLEEGPA